MNPSAQALQVQGRLFLIDCGEGAQQQMRRMHLSFLKVEAILLSHIHGDHVFGIFGMLSTMAMYGRTELLPIYAPASFGPILKFFTSYYGSDLTFPIEHRVVKTDAPVEIFSNSSIRIQAFPLKHKIECYGYRFDEILTERAALKHRPRSYAYCSDTMPFPELSDYVKGVSVLYHEATYPVSLADKASLHFHSTTEDAAQCALAAGAGQLLIGHYTSRIREYSVFENECREIFQNTVAAHDGDVFEIPYLYAE
ncbi:MAG: ribonuclease Z [Bacteroidales bacterium]|nr:ribonuclease Z [Bacteroidales bacterium]